MPDLCPKTFRYVYQNSNCTRTEGHSGGNTVYDQNICHIFFGTRAENVLILTIISCTVVKTAFYVSRAPSSHFFQRFFFFNVLFENGARWKVTFNTVAETSFYVHRRTLRRETNISKDLSFTSLFLGLKRKKIDCRRFSFKIFRVLAQGFCRSCQNHFLRVQTTIW